MMVESLQGDLEEDNEIVYWMFIVSFFQAQGTA